MDSNQDQKLSRSLKSRHITMIAIGGSIGTGLFLGSGTAIQSAGPSIILTYIIVGLACFFMMRALGELLLSDLSKRSFIESIQEYLGDRDGFVAGWTYWSCWLTCAMADLTATGIYLRYWFPHLPQWIGPCVILIFLILINMVSVGMFGELETAFSIIKIAAIVILIAIGAVMVAFHMPAAGGYASLSNLTSHGGFFPRGPLHFFMSFQMVVFAFVGIEMVGLTAGETKNPEQDIPKAINSVPIRIGLFYVGSMLATMSILPWNQIKTSSSPFVQVFETIGIAGAAGIINFVVITAAMSATNGAIFSTSRSLYSLAMTGHAPAGFKKLSNQAVPNRALQFSSFILFVVILLNYFMPAGIFEILSGVSTIDFIIIWIFILACHMKYRKVHPKGYSKFNMPLYPLMDWLTMIFFVAVLIILFFVPSTRIALIVSIIFFLALVVGYSFYRRRKANG